MDAAQAAGDPGEVSGVFDAAVDPRFDQAVSWYEVNYPEVIEGKRLVPVQELKEWTGRAGQTIPGWGAFVDSDRPVADIVGTIRHETLHLDQTPGEVLRMAIEDIPAAARHFWNPASGVPWGAIHQRIYLEGDRYRRLYQESLP